MRLHHVGIVVREIAATAPEYARALGLEPRSAVIEDPIQKVRVQFWANPGDSGLVELVEPMDETSPAHGALARGGGLNHLCYEVANLEGALADLLASGAVQTQPIAPAAAFNGRRIVFAYHRHAGLIELLEAASTSVPR